MNVVIFSAIISLVFIVLVIELIRRGKLTFRYALAWLMITVMGFLAVLFKDIIFQLAAWCGFILPSNFIFFTLFGLFILMSLLLTVFICQLNNRNDKMVQELGRLSLEIQQLKKNLKS